MSVNRVSEQLNRRHPLQRLESPSIGFSALVHTVGIAIFVLDYKFLIDNPNQINESYGWHLQYLTIIGLSIALATFTSGLLADLTKSRLLFSLKNSLAVVGAPIEVLISILYWGLRTIDPTLVVPPDLPPLPFSNDLGFHFFPAFLLTLDLLILSPPWPTSTLASIQTLATSTFLAFSYWFWIELCYSRNGFYPYPIFELLDTTQRVGLFAFSAALMTACTVGLRRLYAWVNGIEGARAKSL